MIRSVLSKPVSFSGIGIHTGENQKIILHPANEDTGIVFTTDNIIIRSSDIHSDVGSSDIGTNLRYIKTSEHLMASLASLQIHDCIIEVIGNEIPILDGSAKFFIQKIKKEGGIIQRNKNWPQLYLTEVYKSLNYDLSLTPCDKLIIEVHLYDQRNPIKDSFFSYKFSPDTFFNEIAQARTYGFLEDKDMLHKNNMALGAMKSNCIIIDENFNKNLLRYENEFIRHKVLDIIGDIFRFGYEPRLKIKTVNPTHSTNLKIIPMVLAREHVII